MEIIERSVGCRREELGIGQEKCSMVPITIFVDDYLENVRRNTASLIKNYQSVSGSLERV